jgi:hypothetical protein
MASYYHRYCNYFLDCFTHVDYSPNKRTLLIEDETKTSVDSNDMTHDVSMCQGTDCVQVSSISDMTVSTLIEHDET